MARPRGNTDEVVFEALTASPTPLTAYQILSALQPAGIQSPPIVYRALERLQKDGRIHRLEGLNAYFACHCDHSKAHGVIFAICETCQRVEEWPSDLLDRAIAEQAVKAGFKVASRTLEVRGTCARCLGGEASECAGPSCTGACGDTGHHHHHG